MKTLTKILTTALLLINCEFPTFPNFKINFPEKEQTTYSEPTLQATLKEYKSGDYFNYKAKLTNTTNDTIKITNEGFKAYLLSEKDTLINFTSKDNFSINLYPQGYFQIETKGDTLLKRISGATINYEGNITDIPTFLAVNKSEIAPGFKFDREGTYSLSAQIDYNDSLLINYSHPFYVGVGTWVRK